jgi:hypothetical protein
MAENPQNVAKSMTDWFKVKFEMFELSQYPPFRRIVDESDAELFVPGRETEVGTKFWNAVDTEDKRISGLAQDAFNNYSMTSSLFSRPFSKISIEFEDELTEARLYKKRYSDFREAIYAESNLRNK